MCRCSSKWKPMVSAYADGTRHGVYVCMYNYVVKHFQVFKYFSNYNFQILYPEINGCCYCMAIVMPYNPYVCYSN